VITKDVVVEFQLIVSPNLPRFGRSVISCNWDEVEPQVGLEGEKLDSPCNEIMYVQHRKSGTLNEKATVRIFWASHGVELVWLTENDINAGLII